MSHEVEIQLHEQGKSPEDGDRLSTIERSLAAAAMGAICLISLGNVIVRYFTNFSFAFTEEYSVFLLFLMTFVGSSAAFSMRSHIRIGILADRAGALRKPLAFIAGLVTLFVLGALLYYGALRTVDQYRFDELSAGLGHPTWIYTVWMPALTLLMMVRVVQRLWKDLRPR